MTVARSVLVDESKPGFYHCISRCVRRAHLCGEGYEHRQDWIQDRLKELADIFAIDVCGYAVLVNHSHLVLHTDPHRVASWADMEVVRRWRNLFPKRNKSGTIIPPTDQQLSQLAADTKTVELWRKRLSSLSWFMRTLKEPIARRANKEDGCTGRFWEGRFKCHALLDDAALLACCVYVDLNQIRAGQSDTPEASHHTSVQDRIEHRRNHAKTEAMLQGPRLHGQSISTVSADLVNGAEDGIWLAPIRRNAMESAGGNGSQSRVGISHLNLDQYLQLVDATGRIVRGDKAGAIPQELLPILDRLAIDADQWFKSMRSTRRMLGTAIGSAKSLAVEAARRGTKWVVSALDVYRKQAVII